jgi:hypothetical protein
MMSTSRGPEWAGSLLRCEIGSPWIVGRPASRAVLRSPSKREKSFLGSSWGHGCSLKTPSRRHEALRPRFYPTGGLATKG